MRQEMAKATISGVRVVPSSQLTFTVVKFATANATIAHTSTTNAIWPARKRRRSVAGEAVSAIA